MKTLIKPICLVVLATASSFSLAQDKKVFSANATKGQKMTLQLTGQVDVGNGMNATISGHINAIVYSSDEKKITVEETTTKMSFQTNGQSMQIPDSPAVFSEVDRQNHLLLIKGDGIQATNYMSTYLTNFIYSKDAVGVGDSWTYKYAANKDLGTSDATANFKIVGTEKMDSVDCYKVSLDSETNFIGVDASVKGFAWIAQDDGRVIKEVQTWVNVPTANAPMPVSGTFTLERVNDDAATAKDGSGGGSR